MSDGSGGPFELVIATGDPQGIGPEVSVAAAWRAIQGGLDAGCVLVGDRAILKAAGASDSWPRAAPETTPGKITVLEAPLPAALRGRPPSEAGGRAAISALDLALARVLEKPGRALVTAPLSKAAVAVHSPSFDGHTGYLARRLSTPFPVMMFVTRAFRVALATVHVPLAKVASLVTAERLRAVVTVVRDDLARRFAIPDARIHVLGLNPHAGEGGAIGAEEKDVVVPAIETLKNEGFRISGPYPADSYFRPGFEKESDAIVAWYHDQGLLPVKCLAFGEAVNVTLGLPIIRTSVDHGTAFDLAGKGEADPGSMEHAIRVARELLARSSGQPGFG